MNDDGSATLDAQFRLDRIADLDGLLARRAATAADARRRFDHRPGLRYGPDAGMTLDYYPAHGGNGRPPLQVFIHGGFWRSLDAALFAFLANGFVPFGAALAVIDYPLIPHVRLADIVVACARAVMWLGGHADSLGFDESRMFVSGNSAGGHLVAELMSGECAPPSGLIAGGCAVSGLFDLAPVRRSSQNETLNLSTDEVTRFSPLNRAVTPHAPLIVAVGGAEMPEFPQQTASFATHWRAAGGTAEEIVVEHADHVTVVLDHLANPESALNAAVRRQMGL